MLVENPQIIKAGAKRYSLLIVALCFCLSLGSIGNAYAMYSHSMTDVESSAHGLTAKHSVRQAAQPVQFIAARLSRTQ